MTDACGICGAKPGDKVQKVDMKKRKIISGEGVEIVINQQGDYLVRRKGE